MDKLQALQDYLRELGSVAVAFSSGWIPPFLLKVAHDTLGDKAIAVTAESCSFPQAGTGGGHCLLQGRGHQASHR